MPLSGEGNAVCELRDMAVYISQISEKKKKIRVGSVRMGSKKRGKEIGDLISALFWTE